MGFVRRSALTREALVQASQGALNPEQLAGTDLVLTVLALSDVIRTQIYEKYQAEHGVSEGNIALLMALGRKDAQGVVELADSMGVKPATVSVMLRRMLNDSPRLVEVRSNPQDARCRTVCLTAQGRKLLEDVLLPGLYGDFESFTSSLSAPDKEQLIKALRGLIDPAASATPRTLQPHGN